MLRRLSEPGIFPAHRIQLESICDYDRGHASDGIVAGCLDKGIEISNPGLRDSDMDLSQWDETHFECVCPRLARFRRRPGGGDLRRCRLGCRDQGRWSWI